MITIFSVNAINIYAGVNGLEAGQSLIIAISLILNNLIQLSRLPEEFALGRERHLFSLYIYQMQKCCLGLEGWNL